MNWLVHASVRAVGGRVAAIPWVFFLITAVLTASGAVVPGAVAIVVPIALGFALTYNINPALMGLMVINGATAGGFSPISVFGSIVIVAGLGLAAMIRRWPRPHTNAARVCRAATTPRNRRASGGPSGCGSGSWWSRCWCSTT